MGQKHSMEDDLITFRLTSKQLVRSARKCDKNMETQKAKLKKAIEESDQERARIYAQNVIREKNQSLLFLRLSSRIDSVAGKLEAAVRMQDVNKAMVCTVQGMANVMKTMDPEQIAKTMADFEKSFEDMDVRSATMESTMESTTVLSTPVDQVDQLISMVADENGLKLKDSMLTAPNNKTRIGEAAQAAEDPVKEMEARLADLRR